MPNQNITPDVVLGAIAQLQKDVYELKRRALPGAPIPPSSGGFPLFANDGTYSFSVEAPTSLYPSGGSTLNIVAFRDSDPPDHSHHAAGLVNIEFDPTSGDANVTVWEDWNQIVGEDFNLTCNRDINLSASSGGVGRGAGHDVNIDAAHDVNIGGANSTNVGGGAKLGFNGAAAIALPAHPATLGDVITILTNYGLCA